MAICFIENVINDHATGTLTFQVFDIYQHPIDKVTGAPLDTKLPVIVPMGEEREFQELMVPWASGDQQLLVTSDVNGKRLEHRFKISYGADSWDYLRYYDVSGKEIAAVEVGTVGNTRDVNWSGWELWLDSRGRVRLERKWRQGLSHKNAVLLGVGVAAGVIALPGIVLTFGSAILGIAAAGATGNVAVGAAVALGVGGIGIALSGITGLGLATFSTFWSALRPDGKDTIRADMGSQLPDVAAGKPAVASSMWSPEHAPGRATDGLSPDIGGWSPTAEDKSSFWQVDLGQPYSLNAIQLITRQDLDQPDTRRNFEIRASNHADMSQGHVVLASQGDESGPFGSAFNLKVADPTPYRYISVIKTKPEYFFIGKLRAFARPTDLAAGKPAAASSVYSPDYGPEKANDGGSIHSGGWSPNGGDTSSFWQVDLGEAHPLSRIDLVTRQDVDQPETRQNFQIWASNNPDMSQGHVVLACQGARPRPFRDVFMAEITDPTPYRYIAAVKTKPEYFFIAKLLVYGR